MAFVYWPPADCIPAPLPVFGNAGDSPYPQIAIEQFETFGPMWLESRSLVKATDNKP